MNSRSGTGNLLKQVAALRAFVSPDANPGTGNLLKQVAALRAFVSPDANPVNEFTVWHGKPAEAGCGAAGACIAG